MKHFVMMALLYLIAIVSYGQNWRSENLDRGLVAIPTNEGNFISWRLLPSDNENITFDVLRDGTVCKSGLRDATSFLDNVQGSHNYQVVAKVGNSTISTSPSVQPWSTSYYLELKLDVPANGSFHGVGYSYSASDCSTADVDGDGQYEIIVKWDPSTAKDNSQSGYTGPCIIDCYKLNGTKLWRVNLGQNIRTGAHYTQFLVYDFDGDGKAEMICKTAPGSTDGRGNFVSAAADDSNIRNTNNYTDYSNGSGYVLSGPEYLTVFNGQTGAAIHTIFYNPNRAGGYGGSADMPSKNYWGDNYGNRGDRFLACVAFLGGMYQNPSAVMIRGYYTRCFAWAVDFNGSKLSTRWLHHSSSGSAYSLQTGNGSAVSYGGLKSTGTGATATAYGNGNHNLSVGDVDDDGKDEIILGGSALDDNGRLLYVTGYGHGDAMHLGDMDPDRPGLEVFTVHEASPYGMTLYAAENGRILRHQTGSRDTGRGMAADAFEGKRGYEFWSSADGSSYNVDGIAVGGRAGDCFRVYWDGDLQDELLGGGAIGKFGESDLLINGKAGWEYGSSCNGTKNTPNLSADIFGDWREEIILHTNTSLIILSSTVPTSYRVPCLMTDHVYRMGVAWQNTAYNQPPHLGYYLPDYVNAKYDRVLESGTYYLYNAKTGKFLSRGGAWAAQAVAGDFGNPVIVTADNNDVVVLRMVDDSGSWIGFSGDVYTDATSQGQYTCVKVADDVYKFKNTEGNYMTITNGVICNTADEAVATEWTLVKADKYKELVNSRISNYQNEVATNSGLEIGESSLSKWLASHAVAIDKTSAITNPKFNGGSYDGWTWQAQREGHTPGVISSLLELYESAGSFTQTVRGLTPGLYKVSVNAFYRDGSNVFCTAMNKSGYSLSNAYICANGSYAPVLDWASQRTSNTEPNTRVAAENMFNNNKYLNEVFAFVDSNGELTITICQPNFIKNSWMAFSNFKLTYYDIKSSVDDDEEDITDDDSYEDYTNAIVNASYDSNNNNGWSGTSITAVTYGCAEQYSKNYDYYQTITGLPAGSYRVGVQAFYRAGYATNDYSSLYDASYSNAKLYATGNGTTNMVDVMRASAEAVSSKLGGSESSVGNGLYIPNNMQAASIYFAAGMYKNYVDVVVGSDGVLTIGIKKDATISGDWTIFDNWTLTYMGVRSAIDYSDMIVNNSYSSNNNNGWGGTSVTAVTYTCAEQYNKNFDYYQTITGLPAGTYNVGVQAFYRAGFATNDYATKDDASYSNAQLYATGNGSTNAVAVKRASSEAVSSNLGGSESSVGNGLLIPNNMQAASIYFAAGKYQNNVQVTVGDDGILTIGIRKSSVITGDWTIFDNWSLTLVPSENKARVRTSDVTSVESVDVVEDATPVKFYSVNGKEQNGLQKGVNIVRMNDGSVRKVFVR